MQELFSDWFPQACRDAGCTWTYRDVISGGETYWTIFHNGREAAACLNVSHITSAQLTKLLAEWAAKTPCAPLRAPLEF